MAYLSVLGPLKEVVGAYAAVQARARAVVSGQCAEEEPAGRGVGAVAADTALQVLSGRADGQLQPVEVHLVVTDRALLGVGDPDRSVMEPARIPGHGSVPAPLARAWLREGLDHPASTEAGAGDGGGAPATGPAPHSPPVAGDAPPPGGPTGRASSSLGDAGAARVWLRRLYTTADGRDLVAMDSRRRLFGGLLRRMLVLRDDVCTTPWCEAPIVHADHATPVREGGLTGFWEGNGKCARCNQAKEAPGWRTRVITRDASHGGPCRDRDLDRDPVRDGDGDAGHPARRAQRVVRVSTPLGHQYESEPPPLLGWGSQSFAPESGTAPHPSHRRKRPLRRQRTMQPAPVTRRPRVTSHLERQLCRYLT